MLDRILIGSSAEPNDPNFKNVTLLLHGDGSNGAQNNTFIDSSTNNFTITRNGNTTQGSFSPYGSNWSNYFDGSGDYLSAPSNTAFDCGTGDWTFEAWVFISTRTNSYPVVFGNNRGAWTTDALALTVSNADNAAYNDKFVFGWNNGGFTSPSAGTSQLLVASSTNSNNTWYHFAVVRNGTSIKMYRDGVQVASATISSGATFNWGYNGALLGGGNWDGAGSYFNGYISNARFVKGTAVYTAAFTPSATPLTAITNTSLLTCQSNRFIDNSTNNFTITRNGDVKVTNFAPFAPSSAYSTSTNGGSTFMDGNGDYLTLASNTNLAPESSAFTWECWFYPNSFVGNTGDGDTLWLTASGLQIGCDANTANWGMARAGVAWRLQTSTFPTNGMWNHLAIVRSGTGSNQAAIFLNGTRVAQGTISDTLPAGSTNVFSSNGSASNCIDGYVSNLRFVKGTAIYDPANSTYTVPTAPLTAVTNTQFLLNGTNAAIFDNSMKNDLETVGNAQISTSVKKFGTGSIYVPSSGEALYIRPNPSLAFGNGAFTMEAWVYPTTLAGAKSIYECRASGSSSSGFSFLVSSGNLVVYTAGAYLAASSTAISANTWTHIALVRSGIGSNQTTYYINGTASGTITMSGNFTDANSITTKIGEFWPGYIDDLRITKGVARYTANFTPPTAAFPNK